MASLNALNARLIGCRRCPRLVAWREEVAALKRPAFAGEEYWGRPVPGFGDPRARLLVMGLAPAAHGANRTGRMFTGDRSGDWLYRALHRAGFADRPYSTSRHDGLTLRDAYITAPIRCAPPGNKPTAAEFSNCHPWLREEFGLLTKVEVILCLGGIAYTQALRLLEEVGAGPGRPWSRFRHGLVVEGPGPAILCCYHPSQQNTFTGRLTEEMLDAVLALARERLPSFG